MRASSSGDGWRGVWGRLAPTSAQDYAMWAGALVVLGIAAAIFSGASQDYARHWDIQWGFQHIRVVFWIGVLGFALNARRLWLALSRNIPSRPSLVALAILVAATGWFTSSNVAVQHRVLSDESSWESMALEMLYHSSGGVCNQGVYENDGRLDCRDVVNNFKGKAWGYVQSIAFHLAPATRDTALRLNFPIFLASLVLFFWFLFLLLRDEWVALAGAAFLAAFPILVFQAQSASTEVLYVFLLALIGVLALLVNPNEADWRFFVLLVPLLGFFAQTRQETIFCMFPIVLYYLPFFRKRPWHLAAFAALVIFASWPILNTMIAYRDYDFQGGQHSAQSLENLWFNIRSNLRIMWTPGQDAHGLLQNPFSTTQTFVLLASSLLLLGQALLFGRRAWGLVLFLTFQLQVLVILVNVSGTFEIDINQRYVLVALPSFALVMALGVREATRFFFPATPPVRLSMAAAAVAVVLGGALLVHHIPSFRANIMYSRNKLLAEEAFLHQELHKLPAHSIFIYARPWQMLCQGLNAFSETTFLGWSDEDLSRWMHFSENNIYLVRGQDGYGGVDLNSRVVGFKTTNNVERILSEYANERILFNSKDFGYPLTVHKLLRRKGANPWALSVSLQDAPEILQPADTALLLLQKSIPDTLGYTLLLPGGESRMGTAVQGLSRIAVSASGLGGGLHRLGVALSFPDSTPDTLWKEFFVAADGAVLLQNLQPLSSSQEWGTPVAGGSVEKNAMRIDGRTFRFGWGMHASSRISFTLDGGYSRFHAYIGLDDESACGDGAQWVVQGDGRELYRSQVLSSHMLDSLNVDIRGVRQLDLLTSKLGDNMCDHTNWSGTWLAR